jgi:hypothetical protein
MFTSPPVLKTQWKNMNIPVENGREIRPNLIRRTGGGWLAGAPNDALLPIGVTASTESEAVEKFGSVYNRWISILDQKLLDVPNRRYRLYSIEEIEAMSNAILDAKHFHDEHAAYAYVEKRIWPNGPVCPHCGGVERIGKLQGKSTRIGVYKCYQCRKPFRATVGTVFEASHVPLRLWLQGNPPDGFQQKGH